MKLQTVRNILECYILYEQVFFMPCIRQPEIAESAAVLQYSCIEKENTTMHMADALLSPGVGGIMYGASAAGLAWSAYKLKKEGMQEQKLPLMAVSGAFVFAAQMINFSIPGTGSSGHIGGGILLAGLLGGTAALPVIAAVLLIQCLFFADGGLLAYGANLFNMGVIPCLFIWQVIYRNILDRKITPGRIWIASLLSAVFSLQLGAFGVVLETLASGVTELPFFTFIGLMQPIHLAIGIVEGCITAAVLTFVWQMRPQLLEEALLLDHTCERYGRDSADDSNSDGAASASSCTAMAGAEENGDSSREKNTEKRGEKKIFSLKKVTLILALLAVVTGGVLSFYASSDPDGLEWSMERTAGTTELERTDSVHETASQVQNQTAIMADYDYEDGQGKGTGTAGILGAGLTCALVLVAGGIAAGISKRNIKR